MSDVSSDEYSSGNEEDRPEHKKGSGGSGSDSEGESVGNHERQHHPQRQLPSSSSPSSKARGAAVGAPSPPSSSAAAAATTTLVLVPCKKCASKSSFAHCLTQARDRTGARHLPRLRAVTGHTHMHPKHAKAVLLPGQRAPPAGVEDGWTEALALTPENLSLR